VPNGWAVISGVPGTAFTVVDPSTYTNAEVRFTGGGELRRPVSLLANRHHALGFVANRVATGAAGVTVGLCDASGAAVLDAQGNAIAAVVGTLAAGVWESRTLSFVTGRTLPASLFFYIRATAPASPVSVCRPLLTPMVQVYSGGPFAAVLSGSIPFGRRSGWSIPIANNRGGSVNNATWQALFDRLFDMRGRRLQLPSAATPGNETILDSLITTA